MKAELRSIVGDQINHPLPFVQSIIGLSTANASDTKTASPKTNDNFILSCNRTRFMRLLFFMV